MEFFQDYTRGDIISAGILVVGILSLIITLLFNWRKQRQVPPLSTENHSTGANLSLEVKGGDWKELLLAKTIPVSGYVLVVAVTYEGPGVARNVSPFVNGIDMFERGGDLNDYEQEEWSLLKPGHTVKARILGKERPRKVTVHYDDELGGGSISDQPPFEEVTRL